ncbi:sensor histidine kinase [Phytomonospora sp. NPDC050363]|uniref:sensor histidine kinase n=1 Tax=Phytomonospora sp. NPDC050363 TaxID=3155642 RepID=UPI0033CA3BE1
MTVTVEQTGRREHAWNRAWALIALALLIPTAIIGLFQAAGQAERGTVLALAAGLAAWHGWWILRHPQWWERAVMPMLAYFTGVVGFLWILVGHDPIFLIAVLGYFPMAFVALPGAWSYPGVAALALLTAHSDPASLLRGELPAQGWTTVAVTALAGGGVGAMIRAVEREAIRRREANTALTAANAELVALAAENAELQARLVAQARRAGVAAERARIARDIHDTVAQGLIGIVTQLETAEAQSAAGDPARHRLATARDLARDSLGEVRRCVEALRPGPLDGADLTEAIEREVELWRHRHDIPATLTVTGTPRPLPPEVEEAILRACQEALANVARHARAGLAGVTLSYMEDMVVADVRDDGDGFDPGGTGGFGLVAMRQRVDALGGNVHVESALGTGTAVSVDIPLKGPAS